MGQCISSQMERQNEKKLVDFPPYKDYMAYGPQAVPLAGTEAANHSAIYRSAKTTDEEHKRLTKEWYEKESCVGILERICKERGKKVCLAYRTLINVEKTVVTDKSGREKTMETYVFDTKRQTMSYELFWDNVVSFGRGLREIGLKRGSRLAIYEETRWQWMNTQYSCWTQGIVVATVYANLGEDALTYALEETKCDAIVCNGSTVAKLVKMFSKAGLKGTRIIYLDQLPAEVDCGEFDVMSWGDVMHRGKESTVDYHVPTPADCDEIAMVMYTSGTTGNPKGVMHSHGSLHCGVRSIAYRVQEILGGPIRSEEWYCSYLPMAHIMEFGVVSVMMQRGVIIGFGSPRTLMDNFAKPHGDFSEYRPMIVAAVPRVFDSMKKAVEANLPAPGTFKRQVFDNAYRARLQALKSGKDTPFYNEKVFALPRMVMGGRVYAMLSGGGPLSAETQEFINVVFGMVVQGWGLTETVCVGGLQRTGNLEYDSVGQIHRTEEMMLLDTEEFKHTDQPEPRGEILLRGPFVFKGYYNQPELTAEALDSDGWFHTGDVGAITKSATLRLVGRVKALAKNANGEYLAMETLESIYGTNELVMPSCTCVLVNPHRSYIALIGLTNEGLVDDFKRKHKLAGKYPDILNDPAFKKLALQSMQKTARDAGRKSFEVVQNMKLLNEEWTPANGVLTAAMKLKRRVIDEKYHDVIQELFKEE